MFSTKEASSTSSPSDGPDYPTQWALNPSAYQNIDASQVDWAALAQQWIHMKESCTIVPAPPPPPPIKADDEAGEADMDVEADNEEWNPNWSGDGDWNKWSGGWNWSGDDDKNSVGYTSSNNATDSQIPGYTTSSEPMFHMGYWTSNSNATNKTGSVNKTLKKYEGKSRSSRSKNRGGPAIVEPPQNPIELGSLHTMDAAKRRQLPAWIREGLEKMEREKQRQLEKEEEKRQHEEYLKNKKLQEEAELERLKCEANLIPVKSKFDSDSSDNEGKVDRLINVSVKPEIEEEIEAVRNNDNNCTKTVSSKFISEPVVFKTKQEIMQEVMLTVRKTITEILLEVTDNEIRNISQEELTRYKLQQVTRGNNTGASKALSKVTALGLTMYGSDSDSDSDTEEEQTDNVDLTDSQLQEIIKRRQSEFERTSRQIEEELLEQERIDAQDESKTPPAHHNTDGCSDKGVSNTPSPIKHNNKPHTNSYSDDTIDIKTIKVKNEQHSHIKKDDKKTKKPRRSTSSSSDSEDSDDSSGTDSSSSSSNSEENVKQIISSKNRKKSTSSERSSKKSKRSSKKPSKTNYDIDKDEFSITSKKKSKKNDKYKYEKSREEDDDSGRHAKRKRYSRSRSKSYDRKSKRSRHSRERRYSRESSRHYSRERRHSRESSYRSQSRHSREERYYDSRSRRSYRH